MVIEEIEIFGNGVGRPQHSEHCPHSSSDSSVSLASKQEVASDDSHDFMGKGSFE